MKKKALLYTAFLACTLGVTSCSDYLDVTPSDKQTAGQLYASKAGFYAAANGIYDGLSNDKLYGKQMTWEAIEVMSQSYSTAKASVLYQNLAANNYTEINVAEALSNIWGEAYSLILASNLLIDQVDQQSGVLTKQEADCLKGEMLAVRAFLHLDMLRLFGPSPVNGLDKLAIPYNESSNVTTLDLLPIATVGEKIIRDLDEAESLLSSDPIIENGPMMSEPEDGSSVQLRYRQYRFNYYSVIALKARAYIWVGDKENAKAQALRLINDEKVQKMFPAVDPNALLANSSNPDRVFSSEVLMGIYDKDRDNVFVNYFSSNAPTAQFLQPYATYITGQYGLFAHMMLGTETSDYRFQSQWEAASGTGATGHNFIKYRKIDQPDATDENSEYYYAKMIPLIKMQEMYYIAMECSADANEKADWYNKARMRRGLPDLDLMGMTPMIAMYWDMGYGNIFASNEYRREFWGEGQWFYFAKRSEIVPGYGIGVGYYYDNGAEMNAAMLNIQPPLPSGEMK